MATPTLNINLGSFILSYTEYVPMRARRKVDRPFAAMRDDVATTAHYMGMDLQQPPLPEVIEPPKAKPALAGLCVTAPDRFKGLGFSDF